MRPVTLRTVLLATALAVAALSAPTPAQAVCRTSGQSCGVSTPTNDRLCCPGTLCGWGGVCQPACRINGTLYQSGARNPANQCQACVPNASTSRWTTLSNGSSCSDGIACTANDTCQTGSCVGGGPRVNDTDKKLQDCVTLAGGLTHLAALQDVADDNNGIRASGTPGYDASAAYVAAQMASAGYVVGQQTFQFQTFLELSPTVLEQTAPGPTTAIDTIVFSYSGSGDVTAAVTPVGYADATPGCEAADFAGFTPGNIALILRGSCTFAIKATNAYSAGAVGVVISNNAPGPVNGTLSATFTLNIGVTSVTLDMGNQLRTTAGLVLHLKTDTFRGVATTNNVFAESPGGSPDNVVMVGAHLDSVDNGPGINDNGSGSAALLEVARQMSRATPLNKVRFAWWGAEEPGLLGSNYYVANLAPADLARIKLYLNFDMIASPNYGRFVYDGDGSAFGLPGPPGSASIEQRFENFYSARSLAFEPTELGGRSDYFAFENAGIPYGGLFTGAEGVKSAGQAAIYGGTAGVAFDPCYHQACDTFANLNYEVFDVNLDAVAHATFYYAMNPIALSFAFGKGQFTPIPAEKIVYQGPKQIR